MSTHPEKLKAEDRNDMARGNGLEWGLATLQQSSQVDVGQRNTRGERDGCQETVKGVLKAGSVWEHSAGLGMEIIVAPMLSWKPMVPILISDLKSSSIISQA